MATTQAPGGELSKGARWMIAQVDSMQASYKESLKAAVSILQYQTRAKTLGLGKQDAPKDMTQRLEDAWAKYELTRRHVEWYMKQNAYYASSPNHPAIIMPTPQPPVMPEQSLQTPSSEMPKASPIPLSAASLLAYSGENVTQPHITPTMPIQPGLSVQGAIPPQSVMDPNIPVNPFGDGSMDFTNTGNNNDSYDLSALGLGELTNLINSADDFFQSTTNPQDAGGDMAMFDRAIDASSQMNQGLTPNTQAATDKLMASLGNLTSASQMDQMGIPSVPPPQEKMDNSTDVEALLASLNASAGAQSDMNGVGASGLSTSNMLSQAGSGDQQQEFTFDFGSNAEGSAGDMDLSELVGLFNVPSENPSRAASKGTTPIPPAQPQQAGQEQQQTGTKMPEQQQTGQAGQEVQSSQQNQQSAQNQFDGKPAASQQQQPPSQSDQSQATQMPPSQAPQTQQQQPQAVPNENQQVASQNNETQQPQLSQQSPMIPSNPFESNGQFDLSNFNMGSNMSGLEGFGTGTDSSGNPDINPFEQNNNGNGGMVDGFDVNMGEEGGIDMDEFNFTDSGMPNVDGDEFESMFAEFK